MYMFTRPHKNQLFLLETGVVCLICVMALIELPLSRYFRPVTVVITETERQLLLLLSDLVEACLGEHLFAADVAQ